MMPMESVIDSLYIARRRIKGATVFVSPIIAYVLHTGMSLLVNGVICTLQIKTGCTTKKMFDAEQKIFLTF